MRLFLTIAIICSIGLLANCCAKPLGNNAYTLPIGEHSCHGFTCPTYTKMCKEVSKTSADKTALEVSINCIGDDNNVLMQWTYNKLNPNPDSLKIKSVVVSSRIYIPSF